MKLSAIYEPGSVVVVPFPFTDRETVKRRPAVVLSTGSFQVGSGHVVLAMVTTGAGSSWDSDVKISDLSAAGLLKPCLVRMKLFTLEQSLVDRRIGLLGAHDWTGVCDMLMRQLGGVGPSPA